MLHTYIGIVILVITMCFIFYYLFKNIAVKTYNNYEIKYKKEKQIISHNNTVKQFTNEIKLNTLEIENVTDEIHKINKLRELYELYNNGVPNKYVDNMIVHGIEPDSTKAIETLHKIIKSPYGTDIDILNLAKIYHYGMHKFERDIVKAESIYMNIYSENPQTLQIIKESLSDINKIRTYAWLNLPTTVNMNDLTNHEQYNTRTNPRVRDRETTIITREPIRARKQDKEKNDPQNTHNSQVLSTVRNTLEKLKNSDTTTATISESDTFKQISEYVNNLPSSDKKKDVLKSLDDIRSNKTPLSSTDMTESRALQLVWNRINTYQTPEDSKEILVEMLSSMQEHGHTVCSTGRFTRIISTLDGIDEQVSIKPTYAILEEMMNKSSKIRDQFILEKPENERRLYEKGMHANQKEYDESLKNTIIKTLKEDYINTKILDEVSFNTEINKWIDHI